MMDVTTSRDVAPIIAPAKAKMDFQTGSDGRHVRASWASRVGSYGMGWNAISGSPYSLVPGGRTARESNLASAVANELATSNPMLATILEVLTTNAIGTGLTLSSKPDATTLGITAVEARALSHQIETGFNAWASNPLECDASGRFDLDSLAAAFFRSYLLSGEGLATLDWIRASDAKSRTKVCLLDSRQLDLSVTSVGSDRNTINGVVFDNRGRVVGYMLREMPLGAFTMSAMARFVPKSTSWGRPRVIHLFELIDPRQIRGLSPLVAALTPSNEKDSLAEFSVINALLQTQYALTIESELPPMDALSGLDPAASHQGAIEAILQARETFYGGQKIEPRPGVINVLPPNDKLKMNKVANGGDTFKEFDKSLSRSASRAAGAMYEDISGNFADTSFSASRLAGEMPYRTMLRRRKIILERFYQTVFSAWLDEAVETGVVRLPAGAPDYWESRHAYATAKWRGIGRVEPDRKKAVEADLLEVENGFATMEAKIAERGGDLDTHLAAIRSERPLMRQAGLDKPFFPGTTTTQIRDENIDEIDPKDGEDPDDV